MVNEKLNDRMRGAMGRGGRVRRAGLEAKNR
jgi:hypothetical protein